MPTFSSTLFENPGLEDSGNFRICEDYLPSGLIVSGKAGYNRQKHHGYRQLFRAGIIS